MTLKTLKDFESNKAYSGELVEIDELKAEAVKRVLECPCDEIGDPYEIYQMEI